MVRSMLTQREGIVAALRERGWRVVAVDDSPEEWWADEVVELESKWSPVGARVVLAFLVDPQHDRIRRKGEGVWAVLASAGRPVDGRGDGPTLSLGQGWQDRLADFAAELDRFRTEGG